MSRGLAQRGSLGAIAVAYLVAAACGGRSEGDVRGTEQTEQAAACRAFASAACARREACAAPSNGSGKRFASEQICRERYTLACEEWARVLKRPISAELAACVPALNRATCEEVTDIFSPQQSYVPDCLRALATKPTAAPCRSEIECESGRCRSDIACGSCSPAVDPRLLSALEGEACRVKSCQWYLHCEAGLCRGLPCDEPGCHDWGRACGGIQGPTVNCPRGTECLNQNDMGRGECRAYATDGEACASRVGPPCLFPALCIEGRCTLPRERSCP